jgi:hypothetical protein
MHSQLLQLELHQYLILGERLKSQYADIDDETLRDTLEGISDLPQLIQEVIRSSLEDESLVDALKARLSEMGKRLERFKTRAEKKRALVCWAMVNAGIDRLQAEDFSISLCHGGQRLEILDDTKVPPTFLVPQPPRRDRSGLLAALKNGQSVEGAVLTYGDPHISVRVK